MIALIYLLYEKPIYSSSIYSYLLKNFKLTRLVVRRGKG